jgi:hypothetical protein
MANAKGYKSFLGIGRQTVLGTVVPRTMFMRFNSETIEEVNRVINSARLAPSQQVVEQGLRFSTGTIVFDGNYEGMEPWFKDLFGSDTITSPGALSRLHTFALADDLPSPGVSLEINKGDLQTHVFSDMKVRRASFSIRANALLQCEFEYIGRIETLVSTSVATYAALLPIASAHLVVLVEGVSMGINSLDLSIDNQLSGEDRPDAAGRDIKEPERMAVRVVEGTMELDYTSITHYNRFKLGQDTSIVATWTGSLIETGQSFGLSFTLPRVRFTGKTPPAAQPGVLPLSLPFRAYETSVGAANEISATIKNRVTSVI